MPVSGLLNKTCTISRVAGTKNDLGEIVQAPSVVASSVLCAVQVLTATQQDTPQAGRTEFDVYFAFGQDVKVTDTLTAVTGYTNMTLTVDSAGVDDAGRGAYTRVHAVYITGRNDAR